MWGRLLSVVFALFTIYGIYLLARRTINEPELQFLLNNYQVVSEREDYYVLSLKPNR